nr:MAG TPA: hypothetical protein [Bacteriophage sp.]DAW61088.1 MAG TPA: hypothetical protein [Caudoviricetes sp.]
MRKSFFCYKDSDFAEKTNLFPIVRSASIESFLICSYKVSFACEKSLD